MKSQSTKKQKRVSKNDDKVTELPPERASLTSRTSLDTNPGCPRICARARCMRLNAGRSQRVCGGPRGTAHVYNFPVSTPSSRWTPIGSPRPYFLFEYSRLLEKLLPRFTILFKVAVFLHRWNRGILPSWIANLNGCLSVTSSLSLTMYRSGIFAVYCAGEFRFHE